MDDWVHANIVPKPPPFGPWGYHSTLVVWSKLFPQFGHMNGWCMRWVACPLYLPALKIAELARPLLAILVYTCDSTLLLLVFAAGCPSFEHHLQEQGQLYVFEYRSWVQVCQATTPKSIHNLYELTQSMHLNLEPLWTSNNYMLQYVSAPFHLVGYAQPWMSIVVYMKL